MSFNQPILIKWNEEGSQKIENEQVIVTTGAIVTLSQIPDEFHKVVIENMYEVKQNKTIANANQFKVNYRNGIITFHEDKISDLITIKQYYGLGYILYSASRIYDSESGQELNVDTVKTLQDYINSVRPYGYKGDFGINELYQTDSMVYYPQEKTIYRCKQLSTGILPTNTTYWQPMISVKTEADYATTQGDYALDKGGYANTQGNYAKSQGDYAKQQGDYANDATELVNDTVTNINNNTLIIWKPYVSNYANITTTYPSPQLGWTTQTQDTGTRYRWNGITWANIGVFSDDKIGDLSQISETDLVKAIQSDRAQLNEKANQVDVDTLTARFDEIITTPVDGNITQQEIIDARQGKTSLGQNITEIKEQITTQIKNELKNGNFVNRVDWSQENCITTTLNNVLTISGDGTNSIPRVWQETLAAAVTGHKIYVRGMFKSTNDNCIRMGFALYGSSSSGIVQYSRVNGVVKNKEYIQSEIIELASGVIGQLRVQLRSEYNTQDLANGKTIEVKKVVCIDLTQIFGYGNEPTREQMDTILSSITDSWFSGNMKINDFHKASTQMVLKDLDSMEKNFKESSFRTISSLPLNRNKYDAYKNEVFRFNSAELRYSGNNISTDEIIKFEEGNTVLLTSTNQSQAIALYNLGSVIDFSSFDYIDLYVYVDNILNLGATQIDFMPGTSASVKFSYYTIKADLQKVQDSGWRYIRIPKRLFTLSGTPTWSNIQYVRVVTQGAYSNTLKINLGKVDGVKMAKGAVSFYFDDGSEGQYLNAFRIMEKYGLRGTINVITSNVGLDDWVKWSQLREMQQAGWLVCSHTHTHQRLWDLSDDEVRHELSTSSRLLFEHGFYFGSKCLVAPFGAYSTRVDNIAKQYYYLVRSNDYGENRINPSMEFPQSHLRFQNYLSPHNTDSVDTIKSWIDNVISKKEEVSIAFHRVDETNTEYTTSIDDFEAICSYVRQKIDDGVLEAVTWLNTMAQSPQMMPIDSEGKQYLLSDKGKPTILTLPV